MMNNDENLDLHVRPRPAEAVTINIPVDALDTLKRVAATRDMSVEALLKFYIGQGLRHDASQLYADHVLELTAEVLARHIGSQEEVAAILQEIHSKAE